MGGSHEVLDGSLAHRADADFTVQPTTVVPHFFIFGNNQLCKIHRDMSHPQMMRPFCRGSVKGGVEGVTLPQGKLTVWVPKLVPVPKVVMNLMVLLRSRAIGDFQDVRDSLLLLHY